MIRQKEQISVFDIFKIGIGPSSSHTLGPWKAASQFAMSLEEQGKLNEVKKISVKLYGSLAKTGKGHGTDIAVQLGLIGLNPETINPEKINSILSEIEHQKRISINNKRQVDFDPHIHIEFGYSESLPYHPNALTFTAYFLDGMHSVETYYSTGGGFIEKEGLKKVLPANEKPMPLPVENASELLRHCSKHGLSIAQVVRKNELALRTESELDQGIMNIWQSMLDCTYRGCHHSGVLPGGLKVTRRAASINSNLVGKKKYAGKTEWLASIKSQSFKFPQIVDWVSCFALAVNEENASFGRVVTAPTNGAAGVIPAVLLYHVLFNDGDKEEAIINFLLTASEIGSIFKKGATISAAMGGCQAEIGVSSAMAAAALTEQSGGTPGQSLMAAEIAMEHHLGLTCDPIKGLVQIPCIERNTMGAIKAITASQLALNSNPANARVTLDDVVKTMWNTALDMNTKFKETAEGGLAVHVPLGLSEC